MKKFTVMILCVSTFFIGLGGLIESVGARFKSDQRALEIVRLARVAIGGEENIKAVQSLTITGKARKTFEFDNVARVEKGDWELNLQLPNKLSKMIKIQTEDFVGGGNVRTEKFVKSENVMIARKTDSSDKTVVENGAQQKVVIVKKGESDKVIVNEENTNREIRRVEMDENMRADFENHRRSELFRTLVLLLLTTPQGIDAEYVYAGELSVDGTNCEVVQVNSNGASIKLFINKSSHLPVMMSFTDVKPFVFRVGQGETTADGSKMRVTVNPQTEAQTAEFQVKFSDYRTVGGLQFPFKWTQTVDGKADEIIEVSAYETNPANIAEKFKEQGQRIMIRTKKP